MCIRDRDTAAPNRLSYALPLPPGLPPGTYTLAVAPDGGDPLALGPVTIAPTTAWPIPPEQLFPEELMARGRPVAVGGQPPAGGLALPHPFPRSGSLSLRERVGERVWRGERIWRGERVWRGKRARGMRHHPQQRQRLIQRQPLDLNAHVHHVSPLPAGDEHAAAVAPGQ